MKDSTRVNFVRSYKLWAACLKPGEDLLRPHYECIYFSDGYAYASDAHILARVPLNICTTFEPEDYTKLNGYCIHQQLYKTLLAYDNVEIGTEEVSAIDAEGNETVEKHVILSAEKSDSKIEITLLPPKTKAPDFKSVINEVGERKPIRSLGVRAKLLARLADALGSGTLKMRFTEANRKVFIEPMESEIMPGVIGIIMPLHIDEVLPGFEDCE